MAKIDHAAIRTSSYEDAQKFLKMFLTCICGGRSGKNQSANAGSGKVSSSVKFLPSTQMQRTDMTTFPLPLILWKNNGKDQSLSGKADQ